MNTFPTSFRRSSRPTPGNRALVLGGGGSTGNAWLIGVVTGLLDTGLDATAADLIVGTSAGSTAAVQICGARPSALFADILTAGDPPNRPATTGRGRGGIGTTNDHLQRTNAIIAGARDARDMRRRMGGAACELDSADPSRRAQWRSTVAARLPASDWPEERVLITAVDARTGEPVVFDRDSGVDVVDAVAASCSGGAASQIGDSWYIDGGYRRNENADLAGGYERVLVLSPFGGRSRMPVEWGMHLAAQVDELRTGGSSVETIFPDGADDNLFGANAMNLALRPAAARPGHAQGVRIIERLREFWA